MNSRLSSRGRTGVKSKSKQLTRRKIPQPVRNNNRVLLFFLLGFLVLLIALVRTRVTPGQWLLLSIVLLMLGIGILSLWFVTRKRAYSSVKARSRDQVRAEYAPALVLSRAQPVTVADLLRLSSGEFEDFVGDLLEITGQCRDIRRIGGAGDRGADLLAKDRFGRPFIVQCKRYSPGHKVSAGEMRNFLGAKSIYGADECLFVTTSTFTDAARLNMVQFRHVVFLLDGESLVQMVREHWDALPARWRQSILR